MNANAESLAEISNSALEQALNVPEIDAVSSLGYLYLQHRQHQRAITLFSGLRKLDSKNAHYLASLAYAYIVAADYQRALNMVEPYLQTDHPKTELLRLIAARALLGLERYEDARQQLASLARGKQGAVSR